METTANTDHWTAAWDRDLALAGCEWCDSLFLLSPDRVEMRCPYCGQKRLTPMDAEADKPVHTQPPELVLPFSMSEEWFKGRLQQFARRVRFAPADLKSGAFIDRLQPVYLPMWLVDMDVQTQWQAEMGFDYEVVSHRDQFKSGQWHSQQVNETRVRWEPRLGTLQRHYDNTPAPAFEEHTDIESILGSFQRQEAKPYQPGNLEGALVRLPNRPPDDARFEAQVKLQNRAGEECRQASEANHIRQFGWSPEFKNEHWTQLLMPLYTAFYLDDEGLVRMVYIHGQTGKLIGQRRASMKEARRYSIFIGAWAAAFFMLSAVLALVGYFFLPVASLFAGLMFTVTEFLGIAAVLPPFLAWVMNTFIYIGSTQELQARFIQQNN
jgi:hypothetical protein